MRRMAMAAAVAALTMAGQARAEALHPASGLIAERGLAGAEAALAAMDAPGPDDLYALGGVRFLRAVEHALQERWRVGADGALGVPIPLLRLPVTPRRRPEPMEPEFARDLFATALGTLDGAGEALDAIPEDAAFGVRIALSDLWFDVDADGVRRPGEGVFEISGTALGTRPAEAADAIVRFDRADAAWLRAYVHLLSATAEAVLAYDPTEAARTVFGGTARLTGLGAVSPVAADIGGTYDPLVTMVIAMRQQPDPARARAALAHLEGMIAQNRRFWRLVARETDDREEWVPNAAQASALGIELPEGAADAWIGVLDEIEQVLKGERLIPYGNPGRTPREHGTGVNLRAMFERPGPLDPLLMIHGAGLAPWVERGPLASGEAMARFGDIVGGDAMLFAVWLN